MTCAVSLCAAVAVGSVTIQSKEARAAGDASITVGDSTCDLPAAELGKGSVQDPFIINSAASLAEIADCRRTTTALTITGATVNGTDVTFTSDNALGVGHSVTISSVTPTDFNASSVRVIAVTDTTFTVRYPLTVSATYASGGSASIDRDYFKFTADIDLSTGTESWNNVSAAGWTPIPTISNVTIDGNGKTINGLTIASNTAQIALFANLINSTVANLSFTNASVDASGASSVNRASVLVAYGQDVVLRKISVQGQLIGAGSQVGLVAGSVTDGVITDSSSSGTISSGAPGPNPPEEFGGLVGGLSGVVSDSGSTADVNGVIELQSGNIYGLEIGGLAGYLYGSAERVHATGDVIGRFRVGGLIGDYNCCGGILDSFATGDVTAISTTGINTDAYQVGGLIGDYGCCGGMSGSYATGNVVATSTPTGGDIYTVGGLIGRNNCCASMVDNYSTGNVTVTVYGSSGTRTINDIGGSVGVLECCGGETNVYATGDVTVINESAGSIERIGGYAGKANYEYQFVDISAEGDVTVVASAAGSAQSVGGAFGKVAFESQLVNVTSSGNVTVTNGHTVGGLIGYLEGITSVVDSSTTSNVTVQYDGAAKVGGFVGRVEQYDNLRNIEIKRSWSSGTVSVTPFTNGQEATTAGGFIGESNMVAHLRDVYTRSNVSGTSYVGGFIGNSLYSVIEATNIYVANTVTATGTDAVVDAVSNGAFVTNSATNLYDSTLAGSLPNKANFVGTSTSDLKTQTTFSALGWVFDGDTPVWKISSTDNDGYPTLTPRPSRQGQGGGSGSTTTVTVQVPVPAACVVPKGLNIAFSNGSSELSSKAMRQIKRFSTRVKRSNCTTITMRAHYVKNSPLARQRIRVLNAAIQKELWKRRYAVRLKSSTKAISGGPRERTVRLRVS